MSLINDALKRTQETTHFSEDTTVMIVFHRVEQGISA